MDAHKQIKRWSASKGKKPALSCCDSFHALRSCFEPNNAPVGSFQFFFGFLFTIDAKSLVGRFFAFYTPPRFMLLQGWSARLFLVVGIPFCFFCLFCCPFWMHTGFLFFFRVLIHATKKIACMSFFRPFIAHDKKGMVQHHPFRSYFISAKYFSMMSAVSPIGRFSVT